MLNVMGKLSNMLYNELQEENRKLEDEKDDILLLLDRALDNLKRNNNTAIAIQEYFDKGGV